jgi:5-methylcytosine-specific restriction endonuclease McrA
MSGHIPLSLVKQVRERAREICEYCLLPQASQEAIFHLDHVRPRAAAGQTMFDNLALACVTCSLKKSARTHGFDPKSNKNVPFFNPRVDKWSAHFRWGRNCRLVGITATGRTTIRALGMNRPAILIIRQSLMTLGRFYGP